jgi:hypothetical protein
MLLVCHVLLKKSLIQVDETRSNSHKWHKLSAIAIYLSILLMKFPTKALENMLMMKI